ncbi:hypothetical protein PoB_005355600 [Plakobranchus ocellatus]|uniref:Uncharacterized protein n=1 Tax=Plakobranchus ocellatus TaxID=259542 RepID=A0AAV4C2Q7_9GAST|nr:hypothetical protein PoB_005355600 [Plakobranchus ocellatus]
MAHTKKYKDFIQVITRAQGKVPTIILQSQEQMSCSPGPNGVRRVMMFDKTFNLTDVHVTAAVYKNVTLLDSCTMEYSGFFGAASSTVTQISEYSPNSSSILQ